MEGKTEANERGRMKSKYEFRQYGKKDNKNKKKYRKRCV